MIEETIVIYSVLVLTKVSMFIGRHSWINARTLLQ